MGARSQRFSRGENLLAIRAAKSATEIPRREGSAQLALFGSAVLISKANLAVVMAEDVLLADYAAIQMAAQIDLCFFARSN